uniref:Uncharacterized protein n=1 Tax=Arundo donax TaxID=35708 RepID=A0A0A9EV58_ARUDO
MFNTWCILCHKAQEHSLRTSASSV